MIAFLTKTKTGYELAIYQGPRENVDWTKGEKIAVKGKREANTICQARNVQPWNF